jgi:glycosyltransferase involved in cell wall biosynthesis
LKSKSKSISPFFYEEFLMPTKLVIQIPCFNEAEVLPEVLHELPRQIEGVDEIVVLVIDDGSSDATVQVALDNGADFVVRHPQNQGLATAFMTGMKTSLALGADIIVNTDADNQYPSRYIPDLVKPIVEKRASIVIGDRQNIKNPNFSPIKRVLEEFGSWVMRVVSQTSVPDAASGFRAYSRYAALRLHVFNKYSYTLETLIQAGKENMRIEGLPIETNSFRRPSRLHKGMLNFMWRQGGTIIRSYALYQPLKTFSIMSTPFFLVGAGLLIRFLVFYLQNASAVGRYVQSVSIGGTLVVVGIILLMLGVLGDVIRANRQTMEEILLHQRDALRIKNGDNQFEGCRVYGNSKRNEEG